MSVFFIVWFKMVLIGIRELVNGFRSSSLVSVSYHQTLLFGFALEFLYFLAYFPILFYYNSFSLSVFVIAVLGISVSIREFPLRFWPMHSSSLLLGSYFSFKHILEAEEYQKCEEL